MPLALQDSVRIQIQPEVAGRLLAAAESLPSYENKDYYDVALQTHVRDAIQQSCRQDFDTLVQEVQTRLAVRPYSALVSGLEFDEQNRLFVGINRAFGQLVARPYEKPRAQLVHYIQPSTDLPATQGSQFESEKLHTDTADWDPPVKLISMVCVRPDEAGGGRSQLLDVDTLRAEVQNQLGAETLRLLETEAVPWQLGEYLGGGIAWRPVLGESSLCWRRYTIELALQATNTELSEAMVAALDALEIVITTSAGIREFSMQRGDLLFTDNRKTIHARTPIASGKGCDRLMIRSWIHVAQ